MRAGIFPSRCAVLGLALAALTSACAPSRPAAPEASSVPSPSVAISQPETGNQKPKTDLYGDPLPPGAIARMGKANAWPDNGVTYVAFFPDGKTLISGDNTPKNCTICLWETATGKPIRMFVAVLSFSYALSPDAKTMAWGGAGVHLWDVATGEEAPLGAQRKPFGEIAFSPDGKVLASCRWDQATVILWEVATRKEIHSIEGASSPMAFSPDGIMLASASTDNTIRLWDTGTGKELRRIAETNEGLCSIAFSPGGKTLASGSRDRLIHLWDTATGKELLTMRGHRDSIPSIAFSPDGMSLASGSWDKTVRLWKTATGKERLCIPAGSMDTMSDGHGGEVLSVAFSPDGTRLASGMSRKTILIWDVAALLKDRK